MDPEATPTYAVGGNSHDFVTHSDAASHHTAEDFWGGSADADVALYALAEQRFERAIARHRPEMDECLAHLPGHSSGVAERRPHLPLPSAGDEREQ